MWTAILAAATALFGLIGTALTSGVNSSKKENEALKKEIADLKAQLAAAKAGSELTLNDEVGRREKLIAELKAEIEIMEKDLETCRDPAVVRDRLRKLLSVP